MVSFGQKFLLQNTLLNIGNLQKGPNEIENAGDGGARQPKTRSPLDDIKIYGEVSFTHRIISRSPTCPSSNIVVRGRVDHAIGLILNTRFKDAVDKRRFYSCYSLSMPNSIAVSAMLWINSLFTWRVCVSLDYSGAGGTHLSTALHLMDMLSSS